MKRFIAPLAAMLLGIAAISPVAAAKPDDVWRYSETGGPALDEFWSDECEVDVTLAYRLQFSGSRANSLFQVERVLTGPGGTATQLVSLSFRYPIGFEEIEDENGVIWLVYREVAKGSFVWTTPAGGVIYRSAGYAAVTWYSSYDEEGNETIFFDDEVYHGQMPGDSESAIPAVCAAID